MSRHIPTKHLAALHLEDLYQQTEQKKQQWLLTYLDVFVLVIMLVISLIAMSDIQNEQQLKQTPIKQNNLEELTPKVKTVVTKSIKEDPADIKPEMAIQENITPKQNGTVQQKNVPVSKTLEPSPKIKEKTTVVEYHNKNNYKEDKPEQENQLSDETLQNQLKKTVDELGLTDSVDMNVTLGYAQLEIQDNILFSSSEAVLLKNGESVLQKLTPLLAKSSGLIYIEGHTDNRPIKTSKFPSNWELGAARATSVLHYLTSQKLDSSRLRAITYADTKPIADNSTSEGREKNRRVSLVIKVSDKID